MSPKCTMIRRFIIIFFLFFFCTLSCSLTRAKLIFSPGLCKISLHKDKWSEFFTTRTHKLARMHAHTHIWSKSNKLNATTVHNGKLYWINETRNENEKKKGSSCFKNNIEIITLKCHWIICQNVHLFIWKWAWLRLYGYDYDGDYRERRKKKHQMYMMWQQQ